MAPYYNCSMDYRALVPTVHQFLQDTPIADILKWFIHFGSTNYCLFFTIQLEVHINPATIRVNQL